MPSTCKQRNKRKADSCIKMKVRSEFCVDVESLVVNIFIYTRLLQKRMLEFILKNKNSIKSTRPHALLSKLTKRILFQKSTRNNKGHPHSRSSQIFFEIWQGMAGFFPTSGHLHLLRLSSRNSARKGQKKKNRSCCIKDK